MGCCGNRRMPPLKKQIANVTISLANAIAHAVQTGKTKADDAVISKRLSLCQSCRHLDKAAGRCAVCGCFVTLKAGADSERCPIKKW